MLTANFGKQEAISLHPASVSGPTNHRDQALMEDVWEVLASHESLHRFPLVVTVRGGVAHVSGAMASANERALLRRTLSRVRGIYAVWDLIQLADGHPLQILDIGCGTNKQQPGAIGVDRRTHGGVDVVTDLERSLPFAGASVDQIYAVHSLEHVSDLLGLMNEIHRVLRADGVLHVMVPNCEFVNAFADPTHVRYFNRQTFKFFCQPYPGLRSFKPLAITETNDNIFAGLLPVQAGEDSPSRLELARYFD